MAQGLCVSKPQEGGEGRKEKGREKGEKKKGEREKGKREKKKRRKEKGKRRKRKGGAGGIRGDGREPGVASTRSDAHKK